MNEIVKWEFFLQKNQKLLENISYFKVYFRKKEEEFFFEKNQKKLLKELTNIINEFFDMGLKLQNFSKEKFIKLVKESSEKIQTLKKDFENESSHSLLLLLLEDFQEEWLSNMKDFVEEKDEEQKFKEVYVKSIFQKYCYSKFKKIMSNIFQKKESLDYEKITEYLVRKTMDELNLNCIQLDRHLNWKEKCKALERVIRIIKKTQNKIGLPIENIGINEKLSLYITNNYLKKNNYSGLHVWDMKGSLIVLDYESEQLEETWLHEYIHFLDKEFAKKYLMEQQENIENIKTIPKSSISQIILQKISSNENLNHPILSKIAPLITLMLTGKNVLEYQKDILQAKENIKNQLSKNLFYLPTKFIKKNEIINETMNTLIEQYINMPHASFSFLENHDLEIMDENKKIIIHLENFWHQIYLSCQNEKIDFHNFQQNMKNNIIQKSGERSHFGNHLKNLLEEHKLLVLGDTLNNAPIIYKVDNKITNAAHILQKQKKKQEDIFTPKYWLLPLEILARVGQDLVNPILEKYEDDYIDENEKDDVVYLYPYLGKKERELFLNILHNMADYIGIKNINFDLNSIEALYPNLNIDLDENMNIDLKMHQQNLLIPKKK